jgi:predicted secreted protein
MGRAALMDLAITYGKKGQPISYSLQKDRSVPKSRGSCPSGYGIENVYIYKKGIAVIVSYGMPGFEGPDVRHLIVTGKLK